MDMICYVMSKLNVDQENIKLLLADKKADFLIPDYQRPYAWREKVFVKQFHKTNQDILERYGSKE